MRDGNKEPAGKKTYRKSERKLKHWSAVWEMKFPVHPQLILGYKRTFFFPMREFLLQFKMR